MTHTTPDIQQPCLAKQASRMGWLGDFALLTGFVLLVYFSRLTSVALRGEESRRAQVAVEMVQTGDFIVPTQQGDPFFMSSRPPLQAWTIALIGQLRGSIDLAAVRLPSAVAMLLTILAIYAYSRLFLSRPGAVAAGLAYGTMGQVMQLCRLGETDAMFALFVGGSLMVWHAGYVRKWPAWRMWTAAYALVALGTLTKGVQAPVYFAGGVGLYLLVCGQWRQALTRSHAAGIAVFLAIVGAWQVPFFARMGWTGLRHVYFGDVAMHVQGHGHWTLVRHVATYPFAILFGCLLPWSALLLLYLRRDFRRALGSARGHVAFLTCCILAAFPTVWFAPTAKTRFFLSLYPAFAPLVGLAVQRCCEADHESPWRRFWGFCLTAASICMVGFAVLVLAASVFRPAAAIAQPAWLAALLAMVVIALAALAVWSGNSRAPAMRAGGAMALAAFLGLAYTGVVVSALVRDSDTTAESAVAELKTKLPEGKKLVSLGPADHLFAFCYGDPIPLLGWPQTANDLPAGVEYFCFALDGDAPARPAFDFEQLGIVQCDRTRGSQKRLMIVGKVARAPAVETASPQGNSRR